MVLIFTDFKITYYICSRFKLWWFYRQMMRVKNYMRRKKKSKISNKMVWDLSKHWKMQMISVFYSSMKYRRHGKFLLHCRQI